MLNQNFIKNAIIKITDNEYVNVFVTEVNSVEELTSYKQEFIQLNTRKAWCIIANTHVSKNDNILVTEYYDHDDLFDGHQICIYHLVDATDKEIVDLCQQSLEI